ncbi:MAG TPA: CPBP family intramembrane glutamate endopeptidase, partial [Acidimicrobiia bacterium]|nr:CPBP family intramembrane glutamate endopeptidase [Acidimicrobiia bacterium]
MIRTFTQRHSLMAFVLLACLFSWWLVPISGFPLGSGPFFAAIVVLWLTEGRDGMVGLLRQMTRWRVGWKWYAL